MEDVIKKYCENDVIVTTEAVMALSKARAAQANKLKIIKVAVIVITTLSAITLFGKIIFK